jgi:hypothetical protein
MKWVTLLAVMSSAIALGGCYSTTLRSGLPAGETKMEVDEHWHSGFVGGTQEASGPYDVSELCPQGWSEIKTETSFANGLVELMSLHIYNPQTITVTCAKTDQLAAIEAPASSQ